MDDFIYSDENRKRKYECGGNVAIVEPEGQYGFFRIHMERGSTPQELTGSWTSYATAETAIQNYNNNKKSQNEARTQRTEGAKAA
jgi:hypothetical protein